MVVTAELVQNLIAEQFPQWKDLPVRPVEKSGHDNRIFHLGTGDPACDYAMAWTYFSPAERDVFLRGLDCGAVARARGWALWKALITYDDSDADFRENARHTVREILKECG